jgi:hypothetical protein
MALSVMRRSTLPATLADAGEESTRWKFKRKQRHH